MQDFSTMSDEELFRLNCEVKEAVENRLQKFDPKIFLKMCEQEILFADKKGQKSCTIALSVKEFFAFGFFFGTAPESGFLDWFIQWLARNPDFEAFAPTAKTEPRILVFSW